MYLRVPKRMCWNHTLETTKMSINQKMEKILYFHTAMRMNKLQLDTIQMNLINRILNERSYTQKNADYMTAFT